VNEVPGSRYFARRVVGGFDRPPNPNAMVDPFEVAQACLAEPPVRSLQLFLANIESEIARA
jgi:hypothetical protein